MASQIENGPAPTLLFIPDISGFTKFVSNTEITHSQHIIEELLEEIIDANEIGLEISEIEGDAILFYRGGQAPTAAELLAQVQRMYTRFHAMIRKYETHRICHCGACSNANGLSLKFVVHHGEIAKKKVKDFHKLFGKDLIVAHRLMKNQVPHEEYVLFTHDLLNACSAWVEMKAAAWADPAEGTEEYDSGTVNYCYLTLDALKKHIPPPTIKDYMAPNASQKYDRFERVISAPLETVFSVLTDVTIRAQWIPYLKDNDQINTRIPQHGTAHRCVINDDDTDLYFIGHNFKIEKDVVTFVETEPKIALNVFYTLRRIGQGLTRVERVQCSKNGFFNKIMYLWKGAKASRAWVNGAMDNLKTYCEDLATQGKKHTAEVVLPAE